MNVESFINSVGQQPNVTEGVFTSRFLYRDNTIWLKDPAIAAYWPMVSHCGDFVVRWNKVHWTTRGLSTQTFRAYKSIRTRVEHKWLTDISDSAIKPAVSICLTPPDHPLKRIKVGSTTKTLMLRIHPEQESKLPSFLSDDTEKIQEAFEKLASQLAYGSIKRENALAERSIKIGQLTTVLDEATKKFNEISEPFTKAYYAHEGKHSLSRLEAPIDKSSIVEYAADDVMACAKELKAIMWGPGSAWPKPFGSGFCFQFQWPAPSEGYNEDNVSEVKLTTENGGTKLHLIVDESRSRNNVRSHDNDAFQDRSNQSYDYYWFRDNFEHYRSIMRRLNVNLGPLFGEQPDEWDQRVLAAPLFMSE